MKKPRESRGIEGETGKHQPDESRFSAAVRYLTEKFRHLLTGTAESPEETVIKKLNALGFDDFMLELGSLTFPTDKDNAKAKKERAENSIIRLESIMKNSHSATDFRKTILNSSCVLKILYHKSVSYRGGRAPTGHAYKTSEERISLDEVPQEATEFSTDMLKVIRNVEMDPLVWVSRVFHSARITMLASGDMRVEFRIGREKKGTDYWMEYLISVEI